MEDERRYCSICHCELDDSDDYEVEGQQLCESCFDEHTTTCDHCGEVIWATDSICDDHTTLCTCCFDDHYRRCEGCGRILPDDDVLWCNDLPYCANCYDRLDTEIEEYGYKPDPIFMAKDPAFSALSLKSISAERTTKTRTESKQKQIPAAKISTSNLTAASTTALRS